MIIIILSLNISLGLLLEVTTWLDMEGDQSNKYYHNTKLRFFLVCFIISEIRAIIATGMRFNSKVVLHTHSSKLLLQLVFKYNIIKDCTRENGLKYKSFCNILLLMIKHFN